MSRHEGVSCDSCLKGNFTGRRYKCLICYDYDLCAACYEAGATNTRHTVDHPMQCILTRADYDIYYGGEALTSLELPQSYTCPYCAKMGFTEATLQDHVSAEHAETSYEVVCPLCAAMPGGDPNLMTDDFAGHLTLEHRSGSRDLISFLDEPIGSRHNVRRIPHAGHSTTHISRGAATLRPRRSNMHFSVFSSGGLSSLSPSSRESVDPIAELLSQLSGVRRSASNNSNSTPSQLQQLQMQLQLERQQVNVARQQLERYPRRQTSVSQTSGREAHTSSTSSTSTLMLNSSPVLAQTSGNVSSPSPSSQFLLANLLDELSLQTTPEQTRQDRSQFVQELILSTATHALRAEQTPQESLSSSFQPETQSDQASGGDSSAVTTENSSLNPTLSVRPRNVVMRGRARSDNLKQSVFSSGGLSSLSPSSRESVDPIAELLSQLSGVRRSASNNSNSTPSQLQQLQMQLQLERQQVNVARQQLERYPRRQTSVSQTSGREAHTSSTSSTSTLMLNSSPVLAQTSGNVSSPSPSSQFLLANLLDELSLQTTPEQTRQDRSQFVQELILSTATHALRAEQTPQESLSSSFQPETQSDQASGGDSSAVTTENSSLNPTLSVRPRNVVMRGRARSDNLNAKRRAEANRSSAGE